MSPCIVKEDILPLNVAQSADDKAPLLAADAVGTFKVITGVVVEFVTVLDKSVPEVPNVNAATLVTVPAPELPGSVIHSVPFLVPFDINT